MSDLVRGLTWLPHLEIRTSCSFVRLNRYLRRGEQVACTLANREGSFAFAFYMDRQKEERERGVTIACTTKEFYTTKWHYTVIGQAFRFEIMARSANPIQTTFPHTLNSLQLHLWGMEFALPTPLTSLTR